MVEPAGLGVVVGGPTRRPSDSLTSSRCRPIPHDAAAAVHDAEPVVVPQRHDLLSTGERSVENAPIGAKEVRCPESGAGRSVQRRDLVPPSGKEQDIAAQLAGVPPPFDHGFDVAGTLHTVVAGTGLRHAAGLTDPHARQQLSLPPLDLAVVLGQLTAPEAAA